MTRSSDWDPELVRKEIAGVNWYHQIDLGDGIVTPGVDDTANRMAPLELPADLRGKSVLDIGAWDGVFSFEAERPGASSARDRLLLLERRGMGDEGRVRHRETHPGLRVEDFEIDVMDLSPERVGTFDVVLFVGVLYHLRHPLLALERVASVSADLLVFDSHTAMSEAPSRHALLPRDRLNDDPTNW